MKLRYIATISIIACAIGTCWVAPVQAQVASTAQYNTFMDLFSTTASKWQPVLTGYAKNIFWALAAIDLVIVFFPLVMRGADFGEISGELIRFVLVIGFFDAMLEYGPEWANVIVSSLRQAGVAAARAGASNAPVGLAPGAVFMDGMTIAAKMTVNIDLLSPGVGIALALAWLVLILAFAYMAAMVGVALIESYLIIYGAVIFLGLGGSQYTRDYAITVMRYALAVGAKLFTITLVIDLIQGAFAAWGSSWDNTLTSATALMGLSAIAALVTKMVPDLVQSMITGQTGVGHHVGNMVTTALAAGAAAASGGALGSAMGAAGASEAAGGMGAAGALGSGPISGGPALAQAMQAGMTDRPGLSPGLASGIGTSSVSSNFPRAPSPSPAPAPSARGAPNAGGAAAAPTGSQIARGAMKAVTTLAEMVVPGMEGASAIGGPPRAPAPYLSAADDDFAPAQPAPPAMVVTPAPTPPTNGSGGGSGDQST